MLSIVIFHIMTSKSIAPLSRLLEYSPKYRGLIYRAVICSVLNKVFDLAPPVLIGAAVDVVVQREDSAIAQFGFESVFFSVVGADGFIGHNLDIRICISICL